MEHYKNAILLHLIEKLPRRELIRPLVILGAEATLETELLGHSDLTSYVFDVLKHPHEGNEFKTAQITRRRMELR